MPWKLGLVPKLARYLRLFGYTIKLVWCACILLFCCQRHAGRSHNFFLRFKNAVNCNVSYFWYLCLAVYPVLIGKCDDIVFSSWSLLNINLFVHTKLWQTTSILSTRQLIFCQKKTLFFKLNSRLKIIYYVQDGSLVLIQLTPLKIIKLSWHFWDSSVKDWTLSRG